MKRIGSFIAGLLVGTMLFGGSVAYAAGVVAELSSHRFFVDGQEVKMTAYAINGNNYVMPAISARRLVSMFIGTAPTAVSRLRAISRIPAQLP